VSGARRKHLEPAWLLHHRPWSDTSRIVDLMTRDHGRVTLFAHGARRPKSPHRALLRPFVPLLVSWSGRADGGTLTAAEAGGTAPAISAQRLFSGFYLNELLLKLLPKEDRHESLYEAYGEALAALAGANEQPALRAFERVLLEELGYGLELAHEAGSRRPVEADRYYQFEAGRGEEWSAAPGGTTMGHVHLHVGDLERADAFYGRALGFDQTVWSYPGALFFSAGGYHHHLAANVWSPGPSAPDDEARLLEWELVLPEEGDTSALAYRLGAAAYPVEDAPNGIRSRDPWGTRVHAKWTRQ
jgi:DNA repair protein RecO (recombination protein O)